MYKDIISKNNTALLTGNGFSINFDLDFANIYDRLYLGHKQVLSKTNFKIKANPLFRKRLLENYNSIRQYSRTFENDTFEKIFNDAILFAKFIVEKDEIKQAIVDHKECPELTFGFSHISIAESIYSIGAKKGYKFVNIENWTGLIWIYYALEDSDVPIFEEFLKEENLFIKLIKLGQVNKTKIVDGNYVLDNFVFHGFVTYYKMLMATTIFNDGKVLKLESLKNIDNIDKQNLKSFLDYYKVLITLNYDKILDLVSARNVHHLHGEFSINDSFYVFHQLYEIVHETNIISFSNLKIGDYFFAKGRAPYIYNSSTINSRFNKTVVDPFKELSNLIESHKLNHFMLFGMNVENDYHILRGIMLGFIEKNVKNPIVTYCYYSLEERESFEETWNKVITFGDEYSEYARNIKIHFVDSKEIINTYFYYSEGVLQ